MKLLIFTGPHCPGCRNAPALIAGVKAAVETEKVDVATPGGAVLAANYCVRGVPTVLLLGNAGEVLADWRTLPSAAEVLEEVSAHA